MTLRQLFDKHGCDKGSKKHRYDRVYEPAFKKFNPFTLLEIGIFQGHSVAATVEFVPDCKIIGLDTFQRVQPEDIPALKLPNVRWIKRSSLDKPSIEFEALVPERGFDIIIDDGLHTHDAQRITFENYFPYLHKDGVYFIEDVWPFDIMTETEKAHSWLQKHPEDWSNVKYQQLLQTISPYKVKQHDLRHGYDPDTFILEIRK
jgi:hypothetical protein